MEQSVNIIPSPGFLLFILSGFVFWVLYLTSMQNLVNHHGLPELRRSLASKFGG
jgi:hypothetical protein